MKKFLIVVFAIVSSNICAQNDLKELDYNFVKIAAERNFYNDYRAFEILDGDSIVGKVTTEAVPNTGMEIGVYAGGDYFNGVASPTIGAEVGYHGKVVSCYGGVDFGISQYNKESSKSGEKYLMTNFHANIGVKVFDWTNAKGYLHQNEISLIGEFGYKVRKNYNSFTNETEYFKVKGSAMTYGLGLKYDHKNYMKRSNVYVKAMVYTSQEYYFEGSENKLGASLTLGINFVLGKKTVNKKAINNYFGSVSQYNSYVNQLRKAAKAK